MPSVIRPDAFNPTLIASPPVAVSLEQMEYVRQVLDVACSDSLFANKAFYSIVKILAGSDVPSPEVTSLSPSSVKIGEETFDIHVIGKNFTEDSVIVFNGFSEPTTYVSATELTTGVNMLVWAAPAIVPVAVVNGDVQSDPLMFEFLPADELPELEGNRNFESSRKRHDDDRARVDRTILDVGEGKDRIEKR
jgi:IPT/TIG domain